MIPLISFVCDFEIGNVFADAVDTYGYLSLHINMYRAGKRSLLFLTISNFKLSSVLRVKFDRVLNLVSILLKFD